MVVKVKKITKDDVIRKAPNLAKKRLNHTSPPPMYYDALYGGSET